MLTIRDIAKYCNVSTATVSKAFSSDSDISYETMERVRAAARELGYYPSAAARSLKTQHAYNLGVLTQRFHVADEDIAWRNVQVKNPGHDQLQGAALGADDHVDTGEIPGECMADLIASGKDKRHGCEAEGQHERVQRGGQTAAVRKRAGYLDGCAPADHARGGRHRKDRAPGCALTNDMRRPKNRRV